jgi:glycosyltransferase involved in cell wall biosynthesis
MPEESNRPLLTFGIVAYNQETFIQEAVLGAFSQTYSPLQIILSDDCSGDSTFHIMREMAAHYRGPHQVGLNQNPRNEGLCAHVNRVAGLAQGQLIVGSAGDDISLPNRAERIYEAWEDSGRKATSISSRYNVINEHGRPAEYPDQAVDRLPGQVGPFIHLHTSPAEYISTLRPHVSGCTHAFSPRLFSIFGPLSKDVTYEDTALGFRSVLAGALTVIDEPLVKYRRHTNNLYAPLSKSSILDADWYARLLAQSARESTRFAALYTSFHSDLAAAKERGLVPLGQYSELRRMINCQVRLFSLQARFYQGGLLQRWRSWGLLLCAGASRSLLSGLKSHLMPRFCSATLLVKRNRARLAQEANPAT